MSALSDMLGSKYDCNLSFNRVHIGLQSWSCWGPNMSAILITKGSKYDCNFENRAEHFWPSFLDESCQEKHFNNCSHICSLTEMIAVIFRPFCNQDWTHIWTVSKQRLQSYLDPNMSDIALIIGPPIKYFERNLAKIKMKTFLLKIDL